MQNDVYLRARRRVRRLIRSIGDLLIKSSVMAFADDNQGDLWHETLLIPSFVLFLAGVSKLFQFISEHCLILALGDAVAVDQEVLWEYLMV